MTNIVKTKWTNTWWAAGTTKDIEMDANDSYESSEKHSLQRYVLLLCYQYSFTVVHFAI